MNDKMTSTPGSTEHTRVGEQTLSHRREFDAPASLVQSAHSDPELFVQWMGPTGTTVRLDRFQVESGGSFRYVVESPRGDGWAFRGSYHEVAPGRIIHTWQYEDEPDVTLETLVFTDLADGRSVLEITSTFTSKESCDAMVASGMDSGMDENFQRLDTALAAVVR